ncbi:MAG: thiamine phosphate synthase [Chloroflexota bacterium]
MSTLSPEWKQTLRLIDANLNRAGEGLRVLEEIARMMLNDTALTDQLKTMRHQLVSGDAAFQEQLLQARNSESDVGVDLAVPGEGKERELPLVLVANARRVQESLRVLEELAKIPAIGPKLDSEKFKQARFDLYTIEQKLLSKLKRQDKVKQIAGLYAIIDTEFLKGRDPVVVAGEIIRGGARVIQLRDKVLNKKELISIAAKLQSFCTGHQVLFIMNDYLDVALAADTDGLHVGQEDLPAADARRLLPLDKILGVSTSTVEKAIMAQSEGADYVGVGTIYPTSTKKVTNIVGPERVREVKQAISIPVVAIGGITQDNTAEVVAAGADAVSVISAILGADSPEAASRQIARAFKKK